MQRGAQHTNEKPIKYFSFSRGQFTRRVDENTKGAISRKLEMGPNEGKTIYEVKVDQITGQLIDCKIKNGNYGKEFQLIFDVTEDEHSPEFYALDFKFNSSGKTLLKRLPNIDLSQDLALVCYTIDDVKKKGEPVKNYYAVPYQGEISKAGKVQPAYTRETPNGFPELKQIKVKGKNTWDDSDQLEFMENLIDSTNWPGMPGEAPSEPTPTAPKKAPKVEEKDDFLEPQADEIGF